MNSYARTRQATDRHTVFPQVCPCHIAPTWRQKQTGDLRSWRLEAPVSVTSQGGPRRAFQLSTFRRLSSFILRTPAAFKTPSVVMMRMLAVRVWCPKYRTALVVFHLQLLLLPLGGGRLILQILQRVSSKHIQNAASHPSNHS